MPPWQIETIPTSFLSISPLLCCHLLSSPGTLTPPFSILPVHALESPAHLLPQLLLFSLPLLRNHLQVQILWQVLWPNGV